ncbi:hypothetical protein [Wolbachia endosymbiont (group A) of Anomoia purmunda]|uniref:hypothetical protein n=1 Tax=Wolbachia endosymbiont (group A) of Anomoia purmunda TaxID=2953978 RepID=UPI00222ED9D4|nr:hypothetical protein [Wolbachia endosymbiont (group A) of Anomoia purmunda]
MLINLVPNLDPSVSYLDDKGGHYSSVSYLHDTFFPLSLGYARSLILKMIQQHN